MPWARLDTHVLEHRKINLLNSSQFRLWICGLLHSQKFLTDGKIDGVSLRNMHSFTDARADALVAAGLWERDGNGMQIHDYLDWNDSREIVMREREQSKLRMRKMRELRRNGDASYADVTDDVTPSVTVRTHGTKDVRTSTSVRTVHTPDVLGTGGYSVTAARAQKRGHHAHTFCGENFCVSHNQHELLSRELGNARGEFDLLSAYPRWDALGEPIDNLLPWLKGKIASEVQTTKPAASKLTSRLARIGDDW